MSPQTEISSDLCPPFLELDDVVGLVGLTPAELQAHLRLMAAIKMFELGKISSGTAARIAGMSRLDFFEACSLYRVSPLNLPAEDLEGAILAELKIGEA